MSKNKYGMVYRCQSEWNDCSWSTTNYGDVDEHEALSGHFVSGQMEAVGQ